MYVNIFTRTMHTMCVRACFIQGAEIQQIFAGAHTTLCCVLALLRLCCAARVSQQTNEPLQCCWRSQLFAQQTQDVSSLAGEVCARERARPL
jgi:hypothetical protein